MRDPEDPWQDELAAATPTPQIGPTQHELKRQAIDACHRCDPTGYRLPDAAIVCDHTDQDPAETARRRSAEIRAQMGWEPPAGVTTPGTP